YFVLVSAHQLVNAAAEARTRDRRTDQTIAALRAHRGDALVLCEDLLAQYVLHRYAPDLGTYCLFPDHELGETECVRADYFFTRDLGRKYADFYGEPKLIKWDAVRKASSRYLVIAGVPWTGVPKTTMHRSYPGFVARPLGHGLFELVADPDRGNDELRISLPDRGLPVGAKVFIDKGERVGLGYGPLWRGRIVNTKRPGLGERRLRLDRGTRLTRSDARWMRSDRRPVLVDCTKDRKGTTHEIVGSHLRGLSRLARRGRDAGSCRTDRLGL